MLENAVDLFAKLQGDLYPWEQWDHGQVDLDLDVPPSYQAAHKLMSNFRQLKQNRAKKWINLNSRVNLSKVSEQINHPVEVLVIVT